MRLTRCIPRALMLLAFALLASADGHAQTSKKRSIARGSSAPTAKPVRMEKARMDGVPLFNVDELTAAFKLILSDREAERCAREWFEMFAVDDHVDVHGRYVYRESRTERDDQMHERESDRDRADTEPDMAAIGPQVNDSVVRPAYVRLRDRSEREKAEFLLRFSDFNLDLLSLVSPELSHRIQRVRGESDAVVARHQRQMRELVRDLRG